MYKYGFVALHVPPHGFTWLEMAQLDVPMPMAPLPVADGHARCAQTYLSVDPSPLQSAAMQVKSTRLASLPMPSARELYDARDVLTVQTVVPAAFFSVMLELVLFSTMEAPLAVVSVSEAVVTTPHTMLLLAANPVVPP
jgi:hypothetical protein